MAIEGILQAFELTEVGENTYTAPNATSPNPVVFGGQLIGQSILAALAGQDDKLVKTVHTAFARAADPAQPVRIEVEPVHSGRALGSSTVTISQGERTCVRSMVLLSADEEDFITHSTPAPKIGDPEAFSTVGHLPGWEIRVVDDIDIGDPDLVGPPTLDVWTRFPDAPDTPGINEALLGFATDGFLIGTAMRPHEGVGQAQAHVTLSTAVLSHTLTFHEPFAARDWMLLSHTATHTGHGRSYGRGEVFDTDGSLIASFVQDAMIRPKAHRSGHL